MQAMITANTAIAISDDRKLNRNQRRRDVVAIGLWDIENGSVVLRVVQCFQSPTMSALEMENPFESNGDGYGCGSNWTAPLCVEFLS